MTYMKLGNYVNSGIWSALEPNMAVVCACIPSLRPLFTIFTQGVFKQPLVRGTVGPMNGLLSRPAWVSWKEKSSNSAFSHLGELDDLQPLGHGAFVHQGRQVEELESGKPTSLPQQGINVVTEIEVSTTDRLDYNDRLY